ncbi:MAG: MarR family transcriptional regulator, partial [Chloroflexota bacterium]
MELSRKGSINQKDLTKELYINKATTSREIKKLIAKGYVKRRRDKKDKRNYISSLTEKGKKVIPIIKKVLKEWRGKLLKGFSRDERKFILNALERV